MTTNTLRDECTNCHNIYLTNMAELQRSWVSRCPACKAGINVEFAKAVSGAYAMFTKAGA